MLPFIEVSHLPSSSSFYSAITQPLGLRYLSAGDSSFAGPSGSPTLTYGFTAPSLPTPVFELRQVPPTSRPLKLSRVVLSASSPDAVGLFRALVQRSKDQDGRASFFDDQALGSLGYPLDKTIETDLDGNVMEIVYIPPPGYPEGYTGSTVRKTQSNQSEVSRILSWNYDIAVADPTSTMAIAPLAPTSTSLVSHRRPGRFPDNDMAPVVRRSITSTTTTLVEPSDSLASPRQNANGSVSTSSVVGALLGVAAAGAAIGAGVAYGVMKNDRGRDEFEAPPFQRRSTFPEPFPGDGSQYSGYGPAEKDYLSTRDRRPPPTLVSRHTYSQAPQAAGGPFDDKASRLSSRFKPSGAPSVRTRSEVPASRSQLLLTDAEHRSQASSRQSAKTQELEDMVAADYRSHASSRQTSSRSKYAPSISRSHTFDAAEGASYVSARSHKTASTVRPAPQRQHTEPVSRPASKAPSRASGVPDSYVSAREAPPSGSRAASRISARDLPSLPASRAGSTRVSARHIALPRSGVGSSHAAWDKEDDDRDSIAPSDSISCVGSRRSARLYN